MTVDSSPNQLAPEDLAAWLNERFDGTLMGHMGIRMMEVGPQRAIAEMEVHSGVKTMTGHVHAGAMISLADTAATFAAVASIQGSYLELERFPVAIGLSSQIVSNTQEGTIRAESTVVHGGRTLIVVETRVTSSEGRLLAIVNSTHFVRNSGPKDGAR
ncbi:MAG: PaaI family thioesterase [Chloroflexi bacterium]|nr:PaaI family thioesterase [Chloroflexota bacterium]